MMDTVSSLRFALYAKVPPSVVVTAIPAGVVPTPIEATALPLLSKTETVLVPLSVTYTLPSGATATSTGAEVPETFVTPKVVVSTIDTVFAPKFAMYASEPSGSEKAVPEGEVSTCTLPVTVFVAISMTETVSLR